MFSLVLNGCAGTIITKNNAIKECPFFNVPCEKLNNAPEYPVNIVGEDISTYCLKETIGCVADKKIFLKSKDWMVLGHERCHNFCSNEHFKPKRKFISLIKLAKAE